MTTESRTGERELSREDEIGLGKLDLLSTTAVPCTDECLLRAGNTNCGGCGMSVGLTMLGRALNEVGDTCTLAIPACCGAVTAGQLRAASSATRAEQ